MPLYDAHCPDCGVLETVSSIKDYEANGNKLECPSCGTLVPQKPPAVKTVGLWDSKPLHIKQIGRTFTSQQELDRYCEANGVEAVSKHDSGWKAFKAASRESADALCRDMGYRDSDDHRANFKKHQRDLVAANRQAQIDAYHDKHGSDGKKAVDDASLDWNDPLPGKAHGGSIYSSSVASTGSTE